MAGLLHVVCAGVRADAEESARGAARDLALGLADAEGARAVVVAESPSHLLVATWLEGRAGLEAFAASGAHMAFIMQGVARVTSGMWSAAVDVEGGPPCTDDAPAALFLFGLRAAPPTGPQAYEWEVRALLDDIAALPGRAAAGPTFEERDRFRAAGAVLLAAGEQPAFEAALEGARTRWGALDESLERALAPVSGARLEAR